MERRKRPGYLSKYAKHADISLSSAAEQLRRAGVDYMREFDFEDADRRRAAMRHAERLPFAKPIPGQGLPGVQTSAPPDPDAPEGLALGSFSAAQAKERHYKAELAKLEYEERIGRLVEVEKVEMRAFRLARQVRDAMLNLPSRLAGIFAAETDQRRVHDLMEQEIRQALEALAGAEDDLAKPPSNDSSNAERKKAIHETS